MKTSKRIFHILLSVLLLHGSTVGFQEKIERSETKNHDKTLLALPTAHLSSYTTKQDNYRPQYHILDNFLAGDGSFYSTIAWVAELILCNKLSASLMLSKEHTVRLQNTAIIFPFHTFT